MDSFEGRTAFITGAASGIGLALAERCAAARMNVVLADIEEQALKAAVERVEAHQVRAVGVPVNTMLESSLQDAAEQAFDAFGHVHLLCNNAGVASGSSFGKGVWEIPDQDWQWVMGVNFYGVLYGIRTFVPHMLAHGEPSHVVNTASLAALLPGGGSYGVSKHAVLALTEGLARDLAERGANIRAAVLCPGMVDTNIHDAERNRPPEMAADDAASTDASSAALMQAMLSQGKTPAEIADVVFDALRDDRFYILPHPAWDEFVRNRTELILARGPVASTDMAEIQRRRESGEVF
jgi:NAD(P)-dependent dehydrogenase (short-subunit alcohol dehydrogenase family)